MNLAWLLLAPLLHQPSDASDRERRAAVALAVEALEVDRGLDEEAIRLVRAVPVEWPDAGLGCPREGRVYAQVITPGFRVQLEAGGTLYVVHVGGGNAVVCREGLRASADRPTWRGRETKEKDPGMQGREGPALRSIVEIAKRDLAERLSVSDESIELVEAERVVWPDASLGCPRPGLAAIQVPRDGARVRLRVGERIYSYHSGGGKKPFLCEPGTAKEKRGGP